MINEDCYCGVCVELRRDGYEPKRSGRGYAPDLDVTMPVEEVTVTNPLTGGQKGSKMERFDLLPWPELAEVARLYGQGASKYSARNWEKGYEVSLSFAALMRHLTAFWGGEDYDKQTGCHHLASVIFHASAMMRFTNGYYPDELDDRP